MFKLAGFEGEEDVAKAEILNIPLQGFMIAHNKLCYEGSAGTKDACTQKNIVNKTPEISRRFV